MARLPLDLYAEVETASGARYRWDANQAPGSRLRNFSFRTKIGEGFSDANGQLARRIDQDYPDLELVNTVTLVGADGSVAYEGRLSAMPRELGDTHSIGVMLAGWMSHARDRKFQEIYRDTDLGRWAAQSRARVATIYAATRTVGDVSVAADSTSNLPALNMVLRGPWANGSQVEAYYDSGGPLLSSIYWDRISLSDQASQPSGTFTFQAGVCADDAGTSPDLTADLHVTIADSEAQTFTATTPQRYAAFFWLIAGPNTVASEYSSMIRSVAVYGNHGLALRGTEPDAGFYASDIMRDIVGRFCPMLDPSGIQDSGHVIGQAAFHSPTHPYDAFLELNKYHLWHLGVWEGRRLDFRPYDLTDYDWEIRTDDPGVTFSPQGPSTESLCNGIVVTYTDRAGVQVVLTPDDDSDLADSSSTNPWNKHGIDRWDEITLSTPTDADTAAQLGRAALADRNTAKTPGTITARGYIRDRAGNEQPAWKVRAGDTIAVTNFPNDQPRLVVETDYNDENKTVSIAVDRPFQLLDAYLDRQTTALQARGLA